VRACAPMGGINKFGDKGAEDALMAGRRQVRRNRHIPPEVPDGALPVYGTAAGHFNDAGVDRFYLDLLARLQAHGGLPGQSHLADPGPIAFSSDRSSPIIPFGLHPYLQDIARNVREYKDRTRQLATLADRLQAFQLVEAEVPSDATKTRREEIQRTFGDAGQALLAEWDRLRQAYAGSTFTYTVRDREHALPLVTESLSGTAIRKVELPATDRWGEIVRFLRLEQVPGTVHRLTLALAVFRQFDLDQSEQFFADQRRHRHRPRRGSRARPPAACRAPRAPRRRAALQARSPWRHRPSWAPPVRDDGTADVGEPAGDAWGRGEV